MKYLLQHCCTTTQSCWHKALLSNSDSDNIEKDSWSAHRAFRSCQWQARLHIVGFGLARAGGPITSLCAEWPKASLLWGTQVKRVRVLKVNSLYWALFFLSKSTCLSSFLSKLFWVTFSFFLFFFSPFLIPFWAVFLFWALVESFFETFGSVQYTSKLQQTCLFLSVR